jgi:hypothetical protein
MGRAFRSGLVSVDTDTITVFGQVFGTAVKKAVERDINQNAAR